MAQKGGVISIRRHQQIGSSIDTEPTEPPVPEKLLEIRDKKYKEQGAQKLPL